MIERFEAVKILSFIWRFPNLILSYHLGRRYVICLARFALNSLSSSRFITLDMSELAPLDPDLLVDVLSKHPFVTIDGIFNVRDLGMIPVADSEYITRSGFMYRSGDLSGVTPHGMCHIPLESLRFVVISESREGAAPGAWNHHHIRPAF
jgi:hypothetical protein